MSLAFYHTDMAKYRLICPRCGASVIAASPEDVLWERCPGCSKHVWDLYDARMAELEVDGYQRRRMAAVYHQGN